MNEMGSSSMPEFLPQSWVEKDFQSKLRIYQAIQFLPPSSKFDPEERCIYKMKINLIDFIGDKAPNFLVLLCKGMIQRFTMENILAAIDDLKQHLIKFSDFPIHNIYVFSDGNFVFVKKNIDRIIDITDQSFTSSSLMKIRLSKAIGKCMRYTNKYRSDACKEDRIDSSNLKFSNFKDETDLIHTEKTSEVYRNILFGESVALKFYNETNSRLSEHMLFHEYNILVNLYHRNIIRPISLIEFHQGVWALALEYCSGGRFNPRNDPHQVSDTSFHMKQVAEGLQYMHTKGVAHLNLEPQNLLLSPENTVKICDFKLANNPPEVPYHNFINLIYVPPEQFMNNTCIQSDIWSFGMVLYKLLLNKEPFKIKDYSAYNDIVISDRQRPEFDGSFVNNFNSLYRLIVDSTNFDYKQRSSIEAIIHSLS